MDFEEFGTGRCINCGFLGKMSTGIAIDICFEARYVDRLTGEFDKGSILDQGTLPWCFVGEVSFLDRVRDGKGLFSSNKILTFIKEDRNCPSWYKWREFLSPKEHFEEFKMLGLERRREEFELKLEEINRQERKRTNRIMIWLTIAAIIFAAMQVYAALASINPNHWLFNWLR